MPRRPVGVNDAEWVMVKAYWDELEKRGEYHGHGLSPHRAGACVAAAKRCGVDPLHLAFTLAKPRKGGAFAVIPRSEIFVALGSKV